MGVREYIEEKNKQNSPSSSFHMDIFYIRRGQWHGVAIMTDDNNNSWDNAHSEMRLSGNDVLLLNEHPI
jgi:hypothetical protein